MTPSRRLALGLALLVATLTPALARAQTGSIGGTVTTAVASTPTVTAYDSSGRPVASASGSSRERIPVLIRIQPK